MVKTGKRGSANTRHEHENKAAITRRHGAKEEEQGGRAATTLASDGKGQPMVNDAPKRTYGDIFMDALLMQHYHGLDCDGQDLFAAPSEAAGRQSWSMTVCVL
jgi:hypothetical protein